MTRDGERDYMKRPIYKKWWLWGGIVLLIVLVVGAPLVINESYKAPICDKYITKWTAADALVYYGATLSFIGTVILGALTVWQNKKAQETNSRLLELDTKAKRGYLVPQYHEKREGTLKQFKKVHNIEDPGIALICCGDDNVYIFKNSYTLNSRTVEDANEVFVTCEGEFNILLIPVTLTPEERLLDKLEIEIVFDMENSKKHRYTQILYLGFEKKAEECYHLLSFNSKFID